MQVKKLSILIIMVLVLGILCISSGNVYASTRTAYSDENEVVICKNLETGEETKEIIGSNIATYSAQTKTEGYSPNSQNIMPTSIIGGDERTRVTNTTSSPYASVAYLEATFPNGKTYRGTAFLIHKKLALTTAHCIYRKADGGHATRVQIWPGRNGDSSPFGSAMATKMHLAQGYKDFELDSLDWSMLELNTEIGNNCGWSGIAYSDDYSVYLNKNATVSGYPADLGYQLYQYVATGPIRRISNANSYLYYDIDTGGGQSGSPIWESGYAVGIHAHAETSGNPALNYCCNINKSRFQYFVKYMN